MIDPSYISKKGSPSQLRLKGLPFKLVLLFFRLNWDIDIHLQ